MPSPRILALALSLPLAASQAAAGEPVRYLELGNRAYDTLTSLSVAVPGSNAYRDVPLGAPLRGGGHAATIEIAGADCRYDLRFGFRNGRAMVYPDVDVCGARVSVRALPKSRQPARELAEASRTSP